jgi:hypothetical protein
VGGESGLRGQRRKHAHARTRTHTHARTHARTHAQKLSHTRTRTRLNPKQSSVCLYSGRVPGASEHDPALRCVQLRDVFLRLFLCYFTTDRRVIGGHPGPKRYLFAEKEPPNNWVPTHKRGALFAFASGEGLALEGHGEVSLQQEIGNAPFGGQRFGHHVQLSVSCDAPAQRRGGPGLRSS